jgi:hypothetical protein
MDSGASTSITPFKRDLTNCRKFSSPQNASTANGEPALIKGIGDLKIDTGVTRLQLRYVRYSPAMTGRIASTSQFIGDTDNLVVFSKTGFHWFNGRMGRLYHYTPYWQ